VIGVVEIQAQLVFPAIIQGGTKIGERGDDRVYAVGAATPETIIRLIWYALNEVGTYPTADLLLKPRHAQRHGQIALFAFDDSLSGWSDSKFKSVGSPFL
jgi:hypothetical protein